MLNKIILTEYKIKTFIFKSLYLFNFKNCNPFFRIFFNWKLLFFSNSRKQKKRRLFKKV